MGAISIGKNFEGFKRVEAIDNLLQSLCDEDRRRAQASILRFETYRERIKNEEQLLGHITDESKTLYVEEAQLLASLFSHIHGEGKKAESEWKKFSKLFIIT